jgi:Winged helix DNA-binding domain
LYAVDPADLLHSIDQNQYEQEMNTQEILKLRLYNSGLSNSPFQNAVEAVSHSGAVQAQDFSAAKWALGLRIRNSTDEMIEKAFNDGNILRIHVMRPTWHFVMPEDIRWMTELTAPRVKAVLAGSDRKLGLDDTLFTRSNAAIVKALEGHNYLTRQELKVVLADIGIDTDVQRLGHIVVRAELDGLICSGPKRGKQFTYALLDERVAGSKRADREQSLSWWSGLAENAARSALEMIKSGLNQETLNKKTYWFPLHSGAAIPDLPPALLLSVYDEYSIAYHDRSDISDTRDIERMISRGNALTAVILLNGRVAGSWNKAMKKDLVEIRLNPFRKLEDDEQVARYGRFFGVRPEIVGKP